MDKEIKRHHQYVEAELKKVKTTDQKELVELQAYHALRVQDFQHERSIHLAVTLFFAGLFLFFMAGFITLALIASEDGVMLPLGLLCGLILVVELFYIRHYYKLENGVQGFYKLTEKLYEIT